MEHGAISLVLHINGLLLAGAPWIIGATFFVAITRRAAPALPSYALAAGIGGYVGYLFCVPSMWFLGTEIQLWWLGLVLAHSYVAVGLVGYALARRGRRLFRSYRKGDFGGLSRERCLTAICTSTLLAVLVFVMVYQTTNTPTQAWDVLDFWAVVSHEFLVSTLQAPEINFDYVHRHPPTAALIAAWAPLTANPMQLPSYPHLAWFLLWVSLGLVVYGFARLLDHNRSLSLLISCASMTIPLVEMHVNAPGYAELLILLSVASSSAVIALSLDRFNGQLMCIGVLLGASVLLTKNIALFYLSVLLFPLLFVCIDKYSFTLRALIGACVFASCLFLWWAWRNQLSVSIAGNLVGFDWREGFLFGGWFLTLAQPSLDDIAGILVHAWFFNLSFGVSISLFLVLAYQYLEAPLRCRMTVYFLLCFLVGLSGTVLSFFTDYAFRYAIPGNDTGNSRFSMPLVPFLFLALSSAVRLEKTKNTEVTGIK